MRTIHRFMTGTLVLLLSGCAGVYTAPAPETRQALAPTGRLRVALILENPSSVVRDSRTGEMKGVGFDVGKEFARRVGVPFEPVIYKSGGALVENAKSGQWDVTVLTVSPARAREIDFIAPLLEIERGYLVPSGSSITTLADVDRPGIRVAVTEQASSDIFLSRALKKSIVVRASGILGPLELLKSGKADVVAANKPTLFEMSDQMPGFSRA